MSMKLNTVSLAKVLKDIREGFSGTGNIDDSATALEWASTAEGFQMVLASSDHDLAEIVKPFKDQEEQQTRIKNGINRELTGIFWSHFSPRFTQKYKQIWGTLNTAAELLVLAQQHFPKISDKLQHIPKQLAFSCYQKEPPLSWTLTFQKLNTMASDIFPDFVVTDVTTSTTKTHKSASFHVNVKMWQLIPKELMHQLQIMGILTDQFELASQKGMTDVTRALDLLPTQSHKARSVRDFPQVPTITFISSCFICGLQRHVGNEQCPSAGSVCENCNLNHPTSRCLRCRKCGHSHLFPESDCKVNPAYLNKYLSEQSNRRTRQIQNDTDYILDVPDIDVLEDV